jgi:ABC-type sugar transport system ATPase subunit
MSMREASQVAMKERERRPLSVEVQGLVKWFGNDRAVDGISFSIPRGNFLTLLGPSGCGKTTTLMSIAGLHHIDAGEIRVGDVIYTAPGKGLFLPPEKRDIGMVFQSYAIWPHMTVAQNVAYPLEIRKVERDGDRRPGRGGAAARRPRRHGRASSPPSFPAASSSARRWRARSSRVRGCCCSTSPSPISTSSCASRCASNSSASSTRSASPRSTSPTTRPRRW